MNDEHRPWAAVTRDYDTHPVFADEPFTEREAFQVMFRRYARIEDDAEHGLLRGQFRCSLGELCRRWNKGGPFRHATQLPWTKGRVSSFIARLVAAGMITAVPGESDTLFTVCNLDRYQPRKSPDGERTGSGRVADGERTHRETGFERQDPPVVPQGTGDAVAPPSPPDLSTKAGRDRHYPKPDGKRRPPSWPAEYLAFRAAFPPANLGTDKVAVYVRWRAVVVEGIDPGHLVAAAAAYRRQVEARGTVPYGPKRWLDEEMWEAVGGVTLGAKAAPLVERRWSEIGESQRSSIHFALRRQRPDLWHPTQCGPVWESATVAERSAWVEAAQQEHAS